MEFHNTYESLSSPRVILPKSRKKDEAHRLKVGGFTDKTNIKVDQQDRKRPTEKNGTFGRYIPGVIQNSIWSVT